jgi:hypothetical protein
MVQTGITLGRKAAAPVFTRAIDRENRDSAAMIVQPPAECLYNVFDRAFSLRSRDNNIMYRIISCATRFVKATCAAFPDSQIRRWCGLARIYHAACP